MQLLTKHVRTTQTLLKISQAELASIASVSKHTINTLENEIYEPNKDTLLRIQTAFEQRGIQFLNSGQPGVRQIK